MPLSWENPILVSRKVQECPRCPLSIWIHNVHHHLNSKIINMNLHHYKKQWLHEALQYFEEATAMIVLLCIFTKIKAINENSYNNDMELNTTSWSITSQTHKFHTRTLHIWCDEGQTTWLPRTYSTRRVLPLALQSLHCQNHITVTYNAGSFCCHQHGYFTHTESLHPLSIP